MVATFRKRGDRWRAELCINGVRDSGTFSTKAEAKEWAAQREVNIRRGVTTAQPRTLYNLFDQYEREVSKRKRGHRWESIRLALIGRQVIDGKEFGTILAGNLSASHIARYRDHRLESVSAASVNRELNLISHVFSVARDEWGWLTESPMPKVKRPQSAQARTRRPTDDEINRLCLALGYADGIAVSTISQRVAIAFLFAIETAMRCGEICGLRPGDISGSIANLPMTKNGAGRKVPLSSRARELIGLLPEGETVFELRPAQVDSLFRKAKKRAAVEDLHFHDSRAEALTRLSKKVDVMSLAKISGHRDLRMLLNVYYRPDVDDLAKLLD